MTHNLGFGKAILANEAYATGNYSTAFIPTYFPEGYAGDKLQTADHNLLALASFVLREEQISRAGATSSPSDLFIEFPAAAEGEKKKTFRVGATRTQGEFEVENLENGETATVNVESLNLKANALLTMKMNGETERVQYMGCQNDLEFSYYYRGAVRKVNVYDQRQHAVATHMPVPKVLDLNKVIIAPMPGAVVSVAVEVGQKV